jgi:hypothetical protein
MQGLNRKQIRLLLRAASARERAMVNKPIVIEQPLVIMFEADGGIVCHIHPSAHAVKGDEADVWEWVDKERKNPTTEVRPAS